MPPRYEPVAPIAHGGMARLELARMRGPHGFEKYVAIKRILPQWADDHEFVGMFLDEARLVAKLDHPNVVHVHDFGQDDDGLFLAMEYIHGPNLLEIVRASRRRGEPIPVRHVVAIGIGIAAGLHHAHQRRDSSGKPLGIVHRDVSPTNVLVTYDGVVKVVDFGIAKAVSNKHATQGGGRKGKVAFMSPEQVKAAELDARSDVFALGAVLYELCTGRRAFAGDDELAVMNAVVNHDVDPPSEHRPELPEALEALVLKALHRDASARFDSAQSLERALEEVEGASPSRLALADWVAELVGRRPLPWEELSTDVGTAGVEAVPPGGDDKETRAAATRAKATPASGADATAPTRRVGEVEELPRLEPTAQTSAGRGGSWRWPAAAVLLLGIGGALAASRGGTSAGEGEKAAPTKTPAVAAPAEAEAGVETASPAPAPALAKDVPEPVPEPVPEDEPEDLDVDVDDPEGVVEAADAGPEAEVPTTAASTAKPKAKSKGTSKSKGKGKGKGTSTTDTKAAPQFDPDGVVPRGGR